MVCLLTLSTVSLYGGEFRKDWFEMDLASARLMRSSVSPNKIKADTFFQALKIDQSDTAYFLANREAGFGGRRMSFQQPGGGYVAPWVRLLVYEGWVAQMEIDWACRDRKVWPLFQEAIAKLWGSGLKETENGFHFSFTDRKSLADFYMVVSGTLGSRKAFGVLGSLKEPFDLLVSPLSFLVVGGRCDFSGQTTRGLVAIRELAAAGRIDLIRNAMRGPNPEGRVFAAKALVERETIKNGKSPLAEKDRKDLQEITDSKIPIEVCFGCMHATMPAKDILGTSKDSPLFGVSIWEDTAPAMSGLGLLKKSFPEVSWESSAAMLDLDGDRKIDSARLGRAKGRVYVGVVRYGADKPDVLDFGVDSGVQNAICGVPATLSVEDLENPVEQIGWIDGLRSENGAKGLRISGGECDSIHLFWDHDEGGLGWWRH